MDICIDLVRIEWSNLGEMGVQKLVGKDWPVLKKLSLSVRVETEIKSKRRYAVVYLKGIQV